MATADFEFKMTAEGTDEELLTILSVMCRYVKGEKGAYFTWPEAERGGVRIELQEEIDEEAEELINDNEGELEISAIGPFGHYGVLNDVDIFRDMAEAAPNAYFEAEIDGNTTYTMQNLKCELKDKLLRIETFFENNDEETDAYSNYFQKKLPYRKFLKLFKLDEDDFDELMYDDFIVNNFDGDENVFADMEYDEFVDYIGDECEIDEDEYEEAMEKVRELDIKSYYDFTLDCEDELGSEEEFVYDPIAKEYVDRDTPVLKSNTVYSLNDTIREQLEKKGLPSDDEAIANLSVDEVYSLMAGVLGYDADESDDENFDDEDDFDDEEDFDDED